MKRLSIKSYAKINISLAITGKREDGYHTLDSLLVPIELHDSILMTEIPADKRNFVTIDDFSLGLLHYNLVSTSLELIADKYGINKKYRVFIHKNIPMQAGLGGGSSNAAFAIKGFAALNKIKYDDQEIIDLVTPLGADIPFFVPCKPMRCTGIGEIMTPITIKNNYYVLLVKPSQGCSTKTTFIEADKMVLKNPNIDDVVKALENGDDDLLAESIGNALEEPASKQVPEILEIKEKLKEAGLKIVLMSGSGSTVYGLSTNKKLITQAAKEFENKNFVEVTKILK